MIQLAEILAEDFKYVRVDFYVVEGNIYFGELTFYPCNGFGVFKPEEMDFKFGRMLDLGIPVS